MASASALAAGDGTYFARLATHSRFVVWPSRPGPSDSPVIVSPESLPEYFDGPHMIHGVGTFKFLHRHLNWPEPR